MWISCNLPDYIFVGHTNATHCFIMLWCFLLCLLCFIMQPIVLLTLYCNGLYSNMLETFIPLFDIDNNSTRYQWSPTCFMTNHLYVQINSIPKILEGIVYFFNIIWEDPTIAKLKFPSWVNQWNRVLQNLDDNMDKFNKSWKKL